MAAKSEISKDKSGKFGFHLKAPNGRDHRCQPPEPNEISKA